MTHVGEVHLQFIAEKVISGMWAFWLDECPQVVIYASSPQRLDQWLGLVTERIASVAGMHVSDRRITLEPYETAPKGVEEETRDHGTANGERQR